MSDKKLQEENKFLKQRIAELEKQLYIPQTGLEEYFRKAIAQVPLFGIIVSPTGKIVYCNNYGLKLVGWEASDLLGQDYFDVFVPKTDQTGRRQDYEKAIKREGYWEENMRAVMTRAGELRYLNFSAVVLKDDKGKITGLAKIGADITEQVRTSDALQQSNEALQDLFNNSNDLIFICGMTGDFLFANRTFMQKIGYEADELRYLNIRKLLHSKTKYTTYRNLIRIIQGQGNFKFETSLVTKQGRRLYLEGNVSCRFENNQPIAVRGILYDITDKIRAEKAQTLYYSIANLAVQSRDLQELYQSIHHELGKVIEVNNFYIKLYSDNKQEILFPYYVDEERVHLPRLPKRPLGKGLTDYVMQLKRPAFFYEEEILELNVHSQIEMVGKVPKVWIGVPLWFENEVIGLISVKSYKSRATYNHADLELLDFISGQVALAISRKRTELGMIASEKKFRNIFESFQDIYYHADLNGKIILVSPSVEEITGYTPDEIIGKSLATFTTAGERLVDFLQEIFVQTKIKNYETGLRTKTGRIVQSISNVKLTYDEEGQPIGLEGVVRDITELKRATEETLKAKELAEQSLRVKESFLANMSHEIRTPMNGVIGMIDLMLTTSLNETQQGYMQTVKKSSETLMDILNNILDLSKIEAGKMKLHKRVTDFHTAIEKIQHLFAQQAEVKNNKILLEIAEDVPRYLMADETRLLQIMANLTSNAVKFTSQGIITLSATVLEKQGRKCHIKVAVRDTGIGIAKKDIKLLFDIFSQVDNSFAKAQSGTGLGLAISKELTRLMEGEINVESTPQQGSTFWFTFKANITSRTVGEQDTQTKQNEVWKTNLETYEPHILITDDNEINRRVASEILKKVGCKVDLADSGWACIDKAQKTRYDLILMDIQMPELDGVATTQHLRGLGIDLPPIIAMTAYAMRQDRKKFLSKGLDDYIAKPINAQELISKVEGYIKGKSLAYPTEQAGEPEALPTQGLIDYEKIGQLLKYGGKELVQETWEEFITESDSFLQAIENALATENYAQIASPLHTLKGNAGTLGIMQVYENALAMETQYRQEDYNLASVWDALKQNFSAFQASYKTLLENIEG
ncbi:MAG: PAS domain S-box protein [Bacteroidetes bacterium]|nr:MAG: PAS domain S-box protein [Bacteroidota bacterium]